MKKEPRVQKWFPKHPEKYTGDVNNIITRSSWERRFLDWCDHNSSVIEYSSEETIIPYVCATDSRRHRYFIDVKMKIKDMSGNIKTFLVEIKPHAETLEPKYPGRKTARFINEAARYIKNLSKWKAAKEYAADRGMEFIIITEYELGLKKIEK